MAILNRKKRAYKEAQALSKKYGIKYDDADKNSFSVYLQGDPLKKDLPTSTFTGIDEGVVRPEITNSRLRTYYFEKMMADKEKEAVRQQAINLALLQADAKNRQTKFNEDKNKDKEKGKKDKTKKQNTNTSDKVTTTNTTNTTNTVSTDTQTNANITPLEYINNPDKYSYLNPAGVYVGEDGYIHSGPPSWDSEFWNIMNTDPKIHKQRYESGLDPLYFESPMEFDPTTDVYKPQTSEKGINENGVLPSDKIYNVDEDFMDKASDVFTMGMWKGYLPDINDFQTARAANKPYLVKGQNIYNVFENLENFSLARKGKWKPVVDDSYGFNKKIRTDNGELLSLFKLGNSTGEAEESSEDFFTPALMGTTQLLPGLNIAADLWYAGILGTKAYRNRDKIFGYLKDMNNRFNKNIR